MRGDALIEVEALERHFEVGGETLRVLRGVTFNITEGEHVAIIGPSGSGKSTMMYQLGCLDTPSAGRYRLGGHDVGALTDDELAALRNQFIGFVFQAFNLLSRTTAVDNVALPLRYAGVGIRDGNNNTMYPPPAEVHAAGEVWMGFAWRLRENLRTSLGTAQAVAISNRIVFEQTLVTFTNSATATDFVTPLTDFNSAAAGVGVDHQSEALTGQLVQQLAAHHQVSWTLLAQTGHNTQQVLAMLQDHGDDLFDVAVVSAGVNDVTSSVKADHWIGQQQNLVDVLQQRFGVKHIVLSPVPPMHRFPALPQPLRWFLGQRAHQLNQHLQHWCDTQEACTLLRNDFPMQPDMMAADGFHPSAATYKLWADNVAQVILSQPSAIPKDAHR